MQVGAGGCRRMHSAVPLCYPATLPLCHTSAPVRQHGWAGMIVTGAGKVRERFRLPDQGSLKETTLAANLGCQPWLSVAPGLGHPWPLVIGRHPWPSGDILGCCHRSPVSRAPGSASGRGSASAGTSAPALSSALPPALLTSALVSRAPGSASGRGSASAGTSAPALLSALPPALLTGALISRAPGSASGRGSASASASASTNAPALLSALPPALLTSASVSRAPGHQYRCQQREWRRGPRAGEGRKRICSTLVSPSSLAQTRERR